MKSRAHLLIPVSLHPVAVLLGLLVVAGGAARAEEVTVARYSTLPLAPTSAQQDPLSEIVIERFDDTVTRIGEALEATLAPSGYRLAAEDNADPQREILLALPLPEAHRTIGPLPRREILAVLAGPVWILIEDPVHRLVSFDRDHGE